MNESWIHRTLFKFDGPLDAFFVHVYPLIALYFETRLLSLQYRGENNSHHINTRATMYIHYCIFTIRRQANIEVQQEYHEECTTHGSTWIEAAGQNCQEYDLPLHIALAQ